MQQEKENLDTRKVRRPYEGPLLQAFFTQIFFYMAASSCIMDFGAGAWATIVAGIPFWAIAALLIFRGGQSPPRWKRWFIRWGLIPFVLLSFNFLYPPVSSLQRAWRNYERRDFKPRP